MVERPADVLRMDKTAPAKISGFGRLDATLRKIPGLGIFIVAMILREFGSGPNASGFLLVAFSVMVVGALWEEYVGPLTGRSTTATPAPETPSQPSAEHS